MFLPNLADNPFQSARIKKQNTEISTYLFIGLILAACFLSSLVMYRFNPSTSHIAWLVYLIGAVLIFYKPRYGIYLILFFVLVGDGKLTVQYPFTKNFSSAESLFFISNNLIVNPLESYIALIFISWLGRGSMRRNLVVYRTQLFWPITIFTLFVLFGLVYGIGTGGNLNIALWESRAIFYMVAMFFLSSNLLTKKEHFNTVLWVAMAAIFIEGIIGSRYYLVVLGRDLVGVNSITEHSAAIHMNTLFIFTLASFLYKTSAPQRLLLPLMIPPVLLTYLVTQRRAAFISLIIAIVFLSLILYFEKPRLFWVIAPPMMFLGIIYLAAFWNSSGALAQPAQAVKSVIAQDQASAADQSSNIYREIENLNTGFTIKQKPLTGVGFGQKFFIIWSLPDISFFEWWEYLPHNSIIWIWLKTGVGGFISGLFFISSAIMVSARATWRMPKNECSAIALTGTLYVIMHFIYAYVDISWDTQSMVYVGTVIGMLSAMERVVGQKATLRKPRWPWQTLKRSSDSLLPLPEQVSEKQFTRKA
jgi:hypothetical protein